MTWRRLVHPQRIAMRSSLLALILLAVACGAPSGPEGRQPAPEAGADQGAEPRPAAVVPVTPDGVRRWPHDDSDLAAEPAIVFGVLENGLRVAWRDHPTPPGEVRLALHVAVGSLAEDAELRGACHLLEHLVWMGGQRLGLGPLTVWLDSQERGWGPHAATSSGWRDLVIEVGVQGSDEADLRTALAFFADIADGLSLDAAHVSLAREQIEQEVQAWTADPARRALRQSTARLLAGSRLADTMPMGDQAAVTPAALKSFAAQWLRPDLMTLVIVGDLAGRDPTPLAQQMLGELERPAESRPHLPDAGSPSLSRPFFTVLVPEMTSAQVTLGRLERELDVPATRQDLVDDVPLSLARGMLMLRLRSQSELGRWPIDGVSVGPLEAGGVLHGESLTLLAPPDAWDLALSSCAVELRRVLDSGFTAEEFEAIRGDAMSGLQDAALGAPGRHAEQLFGDMLAAASSEGVPTSPVDDLGLLAPAVAICTAEDCRAALAEAWQVGELSIRYVGPQGVTPLQLRSAYDAAQGVPLNELPEASTFAYGSSEDVLGEVTARELHADLGVTQVRFANGVRFNHKQTVSEPGQVLVRAVVGEGQLAMPAHRSGLAFAANQLGALATMGTVEHSAEELDLIAGDRMARLRIAAGEDAFQLDTACGPDGLVTALEVLSAQLAAPGFRAQHYELRRRQVDLLYDEVAAQMRGPLLAEFLPALFGGDGRFGLPPKDEVAGVTMDDIAAWVGPQFEAAPVEVSVLGDISFDDALAAALRTVALLPARRSLLPWNERRVVSVTSGLAVEREVTAPADLDLVQVHFPTPDGSVAKRRRQLSLLSIVFGERLRERLEDVLGVTPELGVSSAASQVYTGLGDMVVEIVPPRGRGVDAVVACLDEAERIVAEGLVDGELDALRGPQLERVRAQLETNAYWLGVLCRSQRQADRLDQARNLVADYEAVTPAEVEALASQVFPASGASWIVVHGSENSPPGQ